MADRPAPDLQPEGEALPAAELQAMAQALFESRRFAVQLGIERQHLRDPIDALRGEAEMAARRDLALEIEAVLRDRDHAQSERDGMLAERNAMLAARDRALAERDAVTVERDQARAMLDRVTSSTAWRMTGPARRVLQTLLGR